MTEADVPKPELNLAASALEQGKALYSLADQLALLITSGNRTEAIISYINATGATPFDSAIFIHHMIAGHLMYAIRMHRHITGCSLVPASMLVERLYGKLSRSKQ